MQISRVSSNKNNFSGLLNNRALLKSLEFASDNGALFAASTAVILSTFVRPLAILATPKAQKENKEYACSKSIASSVIGFGIMALVSAPIVKAVKNIQDSPEKFLTKKTIKAFKAGTKNLSKSASFAFSSQMIKLSSSFLTILPKAFLTCALIPPVMALFFNKSSDSVNKKKNVSFGSKIPSPYKTLTDRLSGIFAKILNKKSVQDFSKKYADTNFSQHIFNANDILATAVFAKCTMNNQNIKENNKKNLIANASIMTAFTVIGGYAVNYLLKKPTEIFIKKFKSVNKNDKKLPKYIEGIRIAKPALILGGMYYILAPVFSTMLAEKFSGKGNK